MARFGEPQSPNEKPHQVMGKLPDPEAQPQAVSLPTGSAEEALVGLFAEMLRSAAALPASVLDEVRCPECSGLVAKEVVGNPELFCHRCRATFRVLDVVRDGGSRRPVRNVRSRAGSPHPDGY